MLKIAASDSERIALEQMLRQVKQARVRRRLKAIGLIMAGHPVSYAARRIGVCAASVRGWVAAAKQSGWQALAADSYNNHGWRPGRRPKRYVMDATPDLLRDALRQEQRPWARRRLSAILLMLEGYSLPDAARQTENGVRTVSRWISTVERFGWRALTIRPRATPLNEGRRDAIDIDRDALERALRQETGARVRCRLEAISLIAGGHPVSDAASRTGSGEDSVHRWIHITQQSGWQALLIGRRCNRPALTIDVDRDALEQALRWEGCAVVRRRLKAVSLAAGGKSPPKAASMVGCDASSVRRWISIAQQDGWQALMRRYYCDPPGRKPGLKLSAIGPDEAARLREDIGEQLAKKQSAMDHCRLSAADRILARDSVEAVARHSGISALTLGRWMRKLRQGGAAALRVARAPTPPVLEADAIALRALASAQEHRQVAKALLALAHLAEGSTPHDAGTRAGAAPETVRKWLAIFRAGGVAGLHAATITRRGGVPNPPKLTPEQKRELAEIIKANPAISLTKLRSIIRRRFGVAYVERDLLRLATDELGYQIRWKRGRRLGLPTPSLPDVSH